jgi:hypothetical protein
MWITRFFNSLYRSIEPPGPYSFIEYVSRMSTAVLGLHWLEVIYIVLRSRILTLFNILSFCVLLLLLKFYYSNVDHCLHFVLSLFDLYPSVCWFVLHKCCVPTFPLIIGSHIVIVFSTYFIFCSRLNYNQITSIQSGAFNDLPKLTHL